MVDAVACCPPGRCPRNSVGVRDSACVKLRLCGGRTALVGQPIAPSVPARAARIPGIDEFAFRKGRTCGTVVVDTETSRPVDVLPDRETATVADWRRENPGAESPTRWKWQLEVADRRHLLQNLSTAVEKTCRRHRDCLRRPDGTVSGRQLAAPDSHLLDRVRQRHWDPQGTATSRCAPGASQAGPSPSPCSAMRTRHSYWPAGASIAKHRRSRGGGITGEDPHAERPTVMTLPLMPSATSPADTMFQRLLCCVCGQSTADADDYVSSGSAPPASLASNGSARVPNTSTASSPAASRPRCTRCSPGRRRARPAHARTA
ncbi:transposase [Streptomyces sp. NPDC056660]|uniref:transposase n=1 Tax=Streptomyces sp. NPDC056660 TaxID=3345897 RepID=UPI003673888D